MDCGKASAAVRDTDHQSGQGKAGWAMLSRLTGDKLGEFSAQLRYIEIGSAPMPLEGKKRLMRLFPHTRICMHYGLTEASRSIFIEFHGSKDRLDSIGKPSPNVEIRIVNGEGQELAAGERGTILIRGDHVMARYWNETTQSHLKGGFLRSGDTGFKAKDGYLYLCGREDDMINVGGRKVYPAEVEDALRQHEFVADCVCVGIPDSNSITGDSIKAFLIPKPGRESLPSFQELSEFLWEKLDSYKIPTDYDWVSSIPKNASGKIERRLMKDLTRKTLAIGDGTK